MWGMVVVDPYPERVGRNKRSALRRFISNALADVTVETSAAFCTGMAQWAEFIIGPAKGRTRWLIAPFDPRNRTPQRLAGLCACVSDNGGSGAASMRISMEALQSDGQTLCR
jgi:hypothetical protein